MTYSHMGTPTLPSAQLHFTSEFGMGSGGATALLSLNKNFNELIYYLKQTNLLKLKARYYSNRLSLIRSLAMTYSHMGTPTLPSAQLHFTSEFGMGSGGTTALLSLDKTTCMDTLSSRCHGWQRETCISILKNRKVDINNI